MSQDKIDALLRERDGYVARGLKDRLAAVDASLAALGYKTAAPVKAIAPEPQTAAMPKPRGRKGSA